MIAKKLILIALVSMIGVIYLILAVAYVANIRIPVINDYYSRYIQINDGYMTQSLTTTDFPCLIESQYLEVYTVDRFEICYAYIILSGLNQPETVKIYYTQNGVDYSEDWTFTTTLYNGGNWIKIPDSARYNLFIHFNQIMSYEIQSISLLDKTPLRIHHLSLIVLLSIVWCTGVIVTVKKRTMSISQFINLKRYLYFLTNLVRCDFTTKYRRSLLGVLWSVLNPLLMATVISLVFGSVFRFDIEHFPVYFLTGSLIFTFMSEAVQGSLTSVLGNAGLIKKVYVPKYIFPVEKCIFALVNALFSYVAILIVMPFLGVFPKATIWLSWVPLLCTFVFSIGLGMVLAAVDIFFRDIGHLWGVLSLAWMYFTPIFYPVNILPEYIKDAMNFNPVYFFVGYMRDVVLYGTVPDAVTNFICASYALGMLLVGLAVFKKTQDRFILYI